MEENIARTISNLKTWDEIKTFEANAKAHNKLTSEIGQALSNQSIQLGRELVAERTAIDISDLTPAQEKIITAISEYTSISKLQGKYPTRAFGQIKNRGLIGAVEESVTKAKPTKGFAALEEADLENLSYEQIVVDHEIEFTQRAVWFSKRTLGLPVATEIAPVSEKSIVHTRTVAFMSWVRSTAITNFGRIPAYDNIGSAKAMGIDDTQKFGRVLGNIQSRIDYACYLNNMPPIGLAAKLPFEKSWSQKERNWVFPVENMRAATLSHVWSDDDFTKVLHQSGGLSGQAHLLWKDAFAKSENRVRDWAHSLTESVVETKPIDGDEVAGNRLVSNLLFQGSIYTRADLMQLLSTQDATINTGVFRPMGFSSLLLFITKDKTNDRTQYDDHLDGDLLQWQGQSKGRTDPIIIQHQARGLELLVFHRVKKYEFEGAGFRYEGRFDYVSHSGKEPSNFVLKRSSNVLGLATIEAEEAMAFDPSNAEDARKKIFAAIVRRQGQPVFRRELLRAYHGCCAVTGCNVTEVLEAAHIMPYRGPQTNHLSNGLLLRGDLHTLFDLGLIAIDTNLKTVLVAPSLLATDYGQWHGKILTLPAMPADQPNNEALDLHRNKTGL
ncbi:MAG: hypothetical protein JWQ10_4162 [Herbaspirillum sp.]|nr:hypothetical protein [Herbaspirillum sp.]